MASYKMEIDNGIITKTLNFMGRDFTEKWEEEQSFCRSCIESQVMRAFPELEHYYAEIIEEFTCLDEDELLEALEELSTCEQN